MSNSALHHETLSRVLAQPEPSFGTFLGLQSPMAAEVAATAGADWVVLDLEHGASTLAQVGTVVVSVGAYGVPTIVRVPTPERIHIGQVLDAGAAGIMVPRLSSPEEVAQVVSHMNHPPLGDRGVASYNRASRWTLSEDPFPNPATAQCVIQIETLGALDNIDAIVHTPGVDALFVGPMDFSFALGTPGNLNTPVFQKALEAVLASAKEAHVPVGILANDHEAAARYCEQGFSFVAIGSDSTLLAQTLQSNFLAAKAAVTR